jgi:NAD-dependent deacetylase
MGGLWKQYDIMEVASPQGWEKHPEVVLEFYNQRRKQLLSCIPNQGHVILKELEKIFDVKIITQNVDDLHERAGSTYVLHLHGELRKARSTGDPSLVYDIEGWKLNIGDTCEKGFQLRPDVVWFGETLPLDALNEAHQAALHCHAFFSIGTSGVVQPAASLAHSARQKGAVIVEINLDPTPLTPSVDFALHGKSGEILPQLVKELQK